MSYASRTDRNQARVVKMLREIGCSVCLLHAVGGGVPDLLVGHRGHNYLLEVKDGDKPPSRRKLNKLQQAWHGAWRGQVDVVESGEEAVSLVTGGTIR